jgi:hypothetical protein
VRPVKAILLAGVLALALALPSAAAALPPGFFGIAPQTPLAEADASRMTSGGIESVRLPLVWSEIQPQPEGEYEWAPFDAQVALLARHHLQILPTAYGTTRWISHDPTKLPIDSSRARRSWAEFLRAAVERYGPRGEFWVEHNSASGSFVPKQPIRTWQIWNEENFFYFARPASPERYGRLLKASHNAITAADPGARTIAGGLFGRPRQRPPQALAATTFLQRLYRVGGIRAALGGIDIHPYARNAQVLREEVEELRQVAVDNRDAGIGLYVTEIGWGSANDTRKVSFDVGRSGQARELRRAYSFLISERHRLNLKQVYWFSWKDVPGNCNFCGSAGLFEAGANFRAKPAWNSFVGIAHRYG